MFCSLFALCVFLLQLLRGNQGDRLHDGRTGRPKVLGPSCLGSLRSFLSLTWQYMHLNVLDLKLLPFEESHKGRRLIRGRLGSRPQVSGLGSCAAALLIELGFA